MGRGLQKPAKEGEAAIDVPSLVSITIPADAAVAKRS